MTTRAIVLAPAHADSDFRVTRATRALAGVSGWTDVFWDERYPGHTRKPSAAGDRGTDHYIAMRARERSNGLAGVLGIPAAARDAASTASLAYVHASGTEGLLLARALKAVNPRLRLIFDYHDSLPFELSYQLRKRRLGLAYRFARPVQDVVLRLLARHVDGVVGISTGQIEQYQRITGYRGLTLAVPNFRGFDAALDRAPGSEGGAPELVWVGQVMVGRDLDRLVDWVARSPSSVTLALHGGVLHESAAEAARVRLGARVRTHGAFAGDRALSARLGARPIGVFLGWDDPDETGINAIASPNKFFSYVNLGIPIIVDSRLEGLAGDLHQCGAGLAVGSATEFAEAVSRIGREYPSFSRGVARLKARYAQRDLEQELGAFISSVVDAAIDPGANR